jgi:shikimate dehydrogenase
MTESERLYPGLIDNDARRTTGRFAAILGLSPSKGARSPALWNAGFATAGIDARMLPLDVSAARLGALVAALKADARFIGGAVAMPHKQAILALLDRIEPEAQRIGAVNALYRDGSALVGANTDGAGALAELERLTGGALHDKRVVLLGLGGGGLAVAAYLARRAKNLTLLNRGADKAAAFARRLGVAAAAWPANAALLGACDVLINCTSVGNATGDSAASPLGAATDELLAALPAGAIVYDIIYQPSETRLMARARARGLVAENGLGMNLEQAVIAFARACPEALGTGDLDRARLRQIMGQAGS